MGVLVITIPGLAHTPFTANDDIRREGWPGAEGTACGGAGEGIDSVVAVRC